MSDDTTGQVPTEDPTPEPASGAPEPEPEPAGPRGMVDASLDLVQTVIQYIRQEIGAAVRDKAVVPAQETAIDVAVLIGMALVLATGIVWISVGLYMLLAHFIGWIAATFVVGFTLAIIAIVAMAVAQRRLAARKETL
jgi:hypothetical protein